MGIPKFFRFISERWPMISQLVDGQQIPEYDNLYLDMNSILHTCTHSNDADLTASLSEEQMYAAIFGYIDHLFHTIKPQKVFYMAIDGVAPRAKMNQQRSRRFRTALEAETLLKKAIANGEDIPKDPAFDSNSITPGTDFMAKLTTNLKYFVHKKLSEDAAWQNIEIILSGHEVPGEGEHKIMEYIRTQKAQPSYDPNLRHCIYGLDADLIMLGLISHDPHFSLLREEVVFGRSRSKQTSDVTDQTFYLLHLSLVREYMELEFADVAGDLSFPYSFERVLDDFMLIMYVIGNDFLPNLPDLHINKGAFPLLIETFKQAMRKSEGYLTENGTIDFKRLAVWLEYLSVFELENFERVDVDIEWFNKQLENISLSGEKKRDRQGKMLLVKQQKKLVGVIKPWIMAAVAGAVDASASEDEIPSLLLPAEDIRNNLEFVKRLAMDSGFLVIHSQSQDTYTARLDVDGLDPNESVEERVEQLRKTIKRYQSAILVESDEVLEEQRDLYDSKFVAWKNKYYKEKFGFTLADEDEIKALTHNYLEGLQWVLYYYYQGCQSWPWYYKYHYAPRISDIKLGLDVLINFEMGVPFKPFQQLMAVLPARSSNLIPACYRPLMLDEKSPIIDFYPHEVEVDKNGKTADWEAVVKLSFVEQDRLVDAMALYDSQLTPEEQFRNSFGRDLKFAFNPQSDRVYPSSLPGVFGNIEHDHCIEAEFKLPSVEGLPILSGLCAGAKLGNEALAGFPTLKSIGFSNRLMQNGTLVFQQPSRSQSMVLTVENAFAALSVEQFATKFVGKIVYARWPFLREVKVVSVQDGDFKYEQVKLTHGKKVVATQIPEADVRTYNQTKNNLISAYIKTKGVHVGRVQALVYVKPVSGLIRTAKGAYVKTLSKQEEVYPIQLVVKGVINEDHRLKERAPIPIDQEFPLNSTVVYKGSMAYGSSAVVTGHSLDTNTVNLHLSTYAKEPEFGHIAARDEKSKITYFHSSAVAKMLKCHPLFLSKITSSFMLEGDRQKRVNVGLELKFEAKRLKVLGFTKRNERGWEFSYLAVDLLKSYAAEFPALWAALQACKKNIPTVSDVFGTKDPKKVDEETRRVVAWLRGVKDNLIRVSLESDALTRRSIATVESSIEAYSVQAPPPTTKGLKNVPRDAILDPGSSHQLLTTQRFNLGDRVVYVQGAGKVPVFSKGTVVGVTSVGPKVTVQVLFDESLMSGSTMDGRLRTNRGLSLDSSALLNISMKQLVFHSKASKEKEAAKSKKGPKPVSQVASSPRGPKPASQPPVQSGTPGSKAAPDAPAHAHARAPKPAKNAASQRELLSILTKKKNASDPAEGVMETSPLEHDGAVKQVYGTIFNDVMSHGVTPIGMGLPLNGGDGFVPPPVSQPQGLESGSLADAASSAPNPETIPTPKARSRPNRRGRGGKSTKTASRPHPPASVDA